MSKCININDVFRLVAGHSYYSGDKILSAFTCLAEDKTVDFIAPTETRKVVYGKWIDEGCYITTAYGCLDVYRCSSCNREITIDEYDNFCPNCGADCKGGN